MTAEAARFRHDPVLARARMKPKQPLPGGDAMATMWNRIGGLLSALGRVTGLPPAAALAVWMVECGGLPFTRGRPVLRFENHVLFSRWGENNAALFDQHFRFGGHLGVEGARWQNHAFREAAASEWRRFHGDQGAEYRALALAQQLAGRETACLCASFGGPQIMGFNHALVGYVSAVEMCEAFGRSERWQVGAFLDFCAANAIIAVLKAEDWLSFAKIYNGPGNAAAYAAKIAEAHGIARRLIA